MRPSALKLTFIIFLICTRPLLAQSLERLGLQVRGGTPLSGLPCFEDVVALARSGTEAPDQQRRPDLPANFRQLAETGALASSLLGAVTELNEPAVESDVNNQAPSGSAHPDLRTRVLDFMREPSTGTTFRFPLSAALRRTQLSAFNSLRAYSLNVSQRTTYFVTAAAGAELLYQPNNDVSFALRASVGYQASMVLDTSLEVGAGYDFGVSLGLIR